MDGHFALVGVFELLDGQLSGGGIIPVIPNLVLHPLAINLGHDLEYPVSVASWFSSVSKLVAAG